MGSSRRLKAVAESRADTSSTATVSVEGEISTRTATWTTVGFSPQATADTRIDMRMIARALLYAA